MLYRTANHKLVGAGERCENKYGDDPLIVRSWHKIPLYNKRGRVRAYYIEVEAYTRVDGLNFIGLDMFEPYQLSLYWKDEDGVVP